ncbi:MAG: class I SAM-dependent methyltransferase [Anaerolineales bacterium]|nr:class I SAM-dependent methyltransferase [Anaerolineales bacterium]
MEKQNLIDQWKREEQQPFRGWDFSYLDGRYFEPAPPWSYEERARRLLRESDSVLDMGTGGGEKLLEFIDDLPENSVATEGWPPNVPVARQNLEPHGIRVVPYNAEEDRRMPFPDGSFSLIINRHEAYDAGEVARVLKQGGAFLTQQVTGPDLSPVFGPRPVPEVTLAACRGALEQAGFSIGYADEAMGRLGFADVGAFVYYARAAPWDAPSDFSVERYADRLLEMHENRKLSFKMGHFIIQARMKQGAYSA